MTHGNTRYVSVPHGSHVKARSMTTTGAGGLGSGGDRIDRNKIYS